MVDLQPLLAVLTAALGLSFAVERVLEFINGMFDRFYFTSEARFADERTPAEQVVNNLAQRAAAEQNSRNAEELAEIQARLRSEGESLPAAEKQKLEKRLQELQALQPDTSKLEQAERFSEANIFVDPATKPKREEVLRVFWLQIIGALFGIGICLYSKLGIFLKLFQGNLPIDVRFDYLFTGILIGAGSQPVHFLIKFITERKITSIREEGVTAPAAGPLPPEASGTVQVTRLAPQPDKTPGKGKDKSNPAPITVVDVDAPVPAPPSDFAPSFNVPYNGGVDREELQYRHLRQANPDMIVYHHTALHSDTTFPDVVKFIKDKGWLTGYHCVVLKDGTVHAFCRWDRYGNHALGYNRRSLGVALNGNFETDPRVPFANVNGRMGEPKPTDVQLHAAARVVALWCLLYNIPLDWRKTVVPHRAISDKTCPGSNFPEEDFKHLVEFYHVHWQESPTARAELDLYRKKQFLFV